MIPGTTHRIAALSTALALSACAGASPSTATVDVPPAPAATAAASATTVAVKPREEDVLVVGRGEIGLAGEAPVIVLGPDLTRGADASYKKSGPNDLYLVPLGALVDAERRARRLDHTLTIRVDPETPYRVLFEVFFTAGQNEISHFVVEEDGPAHRSLAFDPPAIGPRGRRDLAAEPKPRLHLVAIVTAEGTSFKIGSGNLQPGCRATGPGFTFPRAPGDPIDESAMRSCVEYLKFDAAYPDETSFTITANPMIPFRELMDVVEALRVDHAGKPLLPDVVFGVAH